MRFNISELFKAVMDVTQTKTSLSAKSTCGTCGGLTEMVGRGTECRSCQKERGGSG
jgi:hypothetical protein